VRTNLPDPARVRPSLNEPALPVRRLTAVAVPGFRSFVGLLRSSPRIGFHIVQNRIGR